MGLFRSVLTATSLSHQIAAIKELFQEADAAKHQADLGLWSQLGVADLEPNPNWSEIESGAVVLQLVLITNGNFKTVIR